MCNVHVLPTVDKINLIFHSLNIIKYLFIYCFSSYLLFFQLSFVFSDQIDKNLANMFQFTICQVATITSTLDCPYVCLPDI